MTKSLILVLFLTALTGCPSNQDRPGQPYLFTPPQPEPDHSFQDNVRQVQSQWSECLGTPFDDETTEESMRIVCVACPVFIEEQFHTFCWNELRDRCQEVKYDCAVFCSVQDC